jgi:hypothetical protein
VPPKETTGGAPTPKSNTSRNNLPLLVGIGVVVLAVVAVIIGITH